MDNTQTVQPATQNTNLINKAAKLAFSDFLNQISKPECKGFISEDNNKKIFSFETYLREIGRSEELTYKYCSYIKTAGREGAVNGNIPTVYRLTDTRFLVKLFLLAMLPGILLYLLLAAFLWTFDIPFLNRVNFILFALSWPVILAPLLILQYVRLKTNKRLGTNHTENLIKCFDSDEITSLKNKSRLFVEK